MIGHSTYNIDELKREAKGCKNPARILELAKEHERNEDICRLIAQNNYSDSETLDFLADHKDDIVRRHVARRSYLITNKKTLTKLAFDSDRVVKEELARRTVNEATKEVLFKFNPNNYTILGNCLRRMENIELIHNFIKTAHEEKLNKLLIPILENVKLTEKQLLLLLSLCVNIPFKLVAAHPGCTKFVFESMMKKVDFEKINQDDLTAILRKSYINKYEDFLKKVIWDNDRFDSTAILLAIFDNSDISADIFNLVVEANYDIIQANYELAKSAIVRMISYEICMNQCIKLIKDLIKVDKEFLNNILDSEKCTEKIIEILSTKVEDYECMNIVLDSSLANSEAIHNIVIRVGNRRAILIKCLEDCRCSEKTLELASNTKSYEFLKRIIKNSNCTDELRRKIFNDLKTFNILSRKKSLIYEICEYSHDEELKKSCNEEIKAIEAENSRKLMFEMFES